MASQQDRWVTDIVATILIFVALYAERNFVAQAAVQNAKDNQSGNLTACQHLRRAELRRSRALSNTGTRVRIPRCLKFGGAFEPVQCSNDIDSSDCWCVDKYGVEIPGTRTNDRRNVTCMEPSHCSPSSCRMFCPSGFARDLNTGCSICRCRDACEGIVCPGGQSCQQQEVKCKEEPCPLIPNCKTPRTLANWCPAGEPLKIVDTIRPFLCGTDPGKPTCPPFYECLVDKGNDYGVCCPNAPSYRKPGICPKREVSLATSGKLKCNPSCGYDLECPQNEKCCFTNDCQFSCHQPINVTSCHQVRSLSEALAVSEREGRGYIPNCDGPTGLYSPMQCSRNGLVCWCVNSQTGSKIPGSMGAASTVNCDGVENWVARSIGRSVDINQCDLNICAAICEYGFKVDHQGCSTCECDEPCEGYICPFGSRCEVAKDGNCQSGSALCVSVPICKPAIAYTNPCDVGTPLTDNTTAEVLFCTDQERDRSRGYESRSFFDGDLDEKVSQNVICPTEYKCTKLPKDLNSVCCPIPVDEENVDLAEKQHSMCEYLREFSNRMEGTEAGMELAIISPLRCTHQGAFEARQCSIRKIKVTRDEKRQILENISDREIRKHFFGIRRKREETRLRLHRVNESIDSYSNLGVSHARNAKVMNGWPKQQQLMDLLKTNVKKPASVKTVFKSQIELAEVEGEECWCVDGFGTEIPHSRGLNLSLVDCNKLRESLVCLDLTCRMGCDYGFKLDENTKCPTCQCRDPCDGVSCAEGKECRTVDVSCEGEYCPQVPACLPRKPGQCPFLVPPGPDDSEIDACSYECRSDIHCEGKKRCCSNGCGTQCVEPSMKTACQHLEAIQKHQAAELGIPAKQTKHLVQCHPITGKWKEIQCGLDNVCWCVDEQGQEISGTRTRSQLPVCEANSKFNCALRKCLPCENGYKTDKNGCVTCECKSPCDVISCLGNEECNLITVECIDSPCPKMPICVPKRESVCPEGKPLLMNNKEVNCGPQNDQDACPSTHSCQLNPMTHRGVCCLKTRDVCFETISTSCLSNSESSKNLTYYKFSPKMNKCLAVITSEEIPCLSRNLFNTETACSSVCPVLTQCERLKLKNSMVAKQTGSPIWFQPRCDPVTGNWSPVQCLMLGKQQDLKTPTVDSGRDFGSDLPKENEILTSVCWCADKKGAPLKGTLTKDVQPVCNYRQARRRNLNEDDSESNPLIENLIRQITQLSDIDIINDKSDERSTSSTSYPLGRYRSSHSLLLEDEIKSRSTKQLVKTTTRCWALRESAAFSVSCDGNDFLPTQCNSGLCWCVDEAGNQIQNSTTFRFGLKNDCKFAQIDSVVIDLYLLKKSTIPNSNLHDILKKELSAILGDAPSDLRIEEYPESTKVHFELNDSSKIDVAFAIEHMVKQDKLTLGEGGLKPDKILSRFEHRIHVLPTQQTVSAESSFHTIVFVLATGSAFLVSVLVVFIMLKRGSAKVVNSLPESCSVGSGDKDVDFSSPIFVLNGNEDVRRMKGCPQQTKKNVSSEKEKNDFLFV